MAFQKCTEVWLLPAIYLREDWWLQRGKWHWSYIPLAKNFLNDWNKIYKETEGSFLEAIPFDGSVYIKELAPLYVNNINPECQ
jgi:hypothetical protein